jgi:hypothetical protein
MIPVRKVYAYKEMNGKRKKKDMRPARPCHHILHEYKPGLAANQEQGQNSSAPERSDQSRGSRNNSRRSRLRHESRLLHMILA